MSHKHKFSFACYRRLLSYVIPYRKRLFLGILAGILAGGSLLGGLLMIPKLMQGLEPRKNNHAVYEESSRKIMKIVSDPAKDAAAKKKEIQMLMEAPDDRGELTKKVDDFDRKLSDYTPKSWNLHVRCRKGNVILSCASGEIFSFHAESETGKMTWQFMALFAACFVFLWLLRNFFIYINHYFTRWVGTRVVADMRDEVFRHITAQSMRFFGKIDIGQLISRATNDTTAMEAAVSNSIADATRCPIEIAACVFVIVLTSIQFRNWVLPVVLFAGLPICILPLILMGKRIRKIYKKSLQKIAGIVTAMHEVLSGVIVVKAYHSEDREQKKFAEVNEGYFNMLNKALRVQLLMQPLMEVVAVAATLVFLVFCYSREVSLSILVQLLAPCFMAYTPIKSLAKVYSSIQRGMAAADRYFELIDIHTELAEKPDAKKITSFEKEIRFDKVVFSYDDHVILDKLDLVISKGQTVAVVGETGSGKTTIANLIARFYDVNQGRVLFDDTDVRDLTIASLRDQIGIVSQEAILFNDTIANNIAYGVPDASREEIIAAAKLANADKFITDGRHPQGYDTVVGEKGFLLSGGEKQRVSIARAVLRNPPILILDEATSALDTVTEHLVQEALMKAMKNRTVFVIAHRLSTIEKADKIIVLERGKIMESGNHQELLALGGKYKHLYDTQFLRS